MIPTVKPIGIAIGPVLNILGRTMRLILKQEGVSYSLEQLYILSMVRDRKDTVVQQDLAERLGKDKSVILRIVDSLEKEKLIRRIVDSNDRRRNILEVTYLGNQLMNKFQEIELKVSEALIKDISEEEINNFYNVVSKMRINADKISVNS
jgi:MarR family transcriptional regulator for hemolysin